MERAHEDDDYIVNPQTGKRVLKTGRIGKRILSGHQTQEATSPPFPVPQACIHTAMPACAKCANSATLAQCGFCFIVGPRRSVVKHASNSHKYVPVYPPYGDPNVCECGQAFHIHAEHNLAVHVIDVERPILAFESTLCGARCPHPHTEWVGGFCRKRMKRMATNTGWGWECACCGKAGISPPEPHFGTQTLHTTLKYECTLCHAISAHTKHTVKLHVWDAHVRKGTGCPSPICPTDPWSFAAASIREHFDRVHGVLEGGQCHSGDSCLEAGSCDAPARHVVMFDLHNELVAGGTLSAEVLKYGVDIRDLIMQPGPYSEAEIKRRVKRAQIWQFPGHTYPSLAKLPSEIWRLIMHYMDINTLFAMAKTSCRMRMLANELITPAERFSYNLDRAIHTDKTRMTATRAKADFLLSETELDELDVDLVRNPHYRSAARMRLYDVEELKAAAMAKYGTWEAFVARREKREKRSEAQLAAIGRSRQGKRRKEKSEDQLQRERQDKKRKEEKVARRWMIEHERELRRTDLTAALAAYGLELQADSRMCASYIYTGAGIHGESMDAVVEIMRELQFLLTETSYEVLLDTIKEEYREQGELYMLDDVMGEARDRALRQWRQEHPSADLDLLPPLVKLRFATL